MQKFSQNSARVGPFCECKISLYPILIRPLTPHMGQPSTSSLGSQDPPDSLSFRIILLRVQAKVDFTKNSLLSHLSLSPAPFELRSSKEPKLGSKENFCPKVLLGAKFWSFGPKVVPGGTTFGPKPPLVFFFPTLPSLFPGADKRNKNIRKNFSQESPFTPDLSWSWGLHLKKSPKNFPEISFLKMKFQSIPLGDENPSPESGPLKTPLPHVKRGKILNFSVKEKI